MFSNLLLKNKLMLESCTQTLRNICMRLKGYFYYLFVRLVHLLELILLNIFFVLRLSCRQPPYCSQTLCFEEEDEF